MLYTIWRHKVTCGMVRVLYCYTMVQRSLEGGSTIGWKDQPWSIVPKVVQFIASSLGIGQMDGWSMNSSNATSSASCTIWENWKKVATHTRHIEEAGYTATEMNPRPSRANMVGFPNWLPRNNFRRNSQTSIEGSIGCQCNQFTLSKQINFSMLASWIGLSDLRVLA